MLGSVVHNDGAARDVPPGSHATMRRGYGNAHPRIGQAFFSQSLFEWAISMTYAGSAVSALSLEQGLTCKIGWPLLVRSL